MKQMFHIGKSNEQTLLKQKEFYTTVKYRKLEDDRNQAKKENMSSPKNKTAKSVKKQNQE